MSARRWLWPWLVCLCFSACVRADEAQDAAQQVLVLLKLPAAHFRPDSQYAGSYHDGAGQRARRAVVRELARSHGLTLVSDWPLPSLGIDCYVLSVPLSRAPAQVADALAREPRIAWAQPMNVFRAQGSSHDDPLYPVQPAAGAWRLADLHELATGQRVRVAVIDSGIDAGHPDLAGQVVASVNFVDGHGFAAERHGTAIAGIIAARADDHVGIVGVAPGARLLALRACWQARDDSTLCTSLGLAKALQFALDGDAAIVNLSLSGPPDRLLALLIDQALRRGISVVAALDPSLPGGGFPASHPGVIAVADSMAPGRDVPAPVPGARWEIVSGASYSAAHVSGLFALLRELGAAPSLRPVHSADGSIDTCATLLRLAGPRVCACAQLAQAAPGHAAR